MLTGIIAFRLFDSVRCHAQEEHQNRYQGQFPGVARGAGSQLMWKILETHCM
jgi:hypothetical protein